MSETNPAVADLSSHFRHLLKPTIVAAVLLIAVFAGIGGYLEKWLWMRQSTTPASSGRFCRFSGQRQAWLLSSPFCICGSISARLPKIATPSVEPLKQGGSICRETLFCREPIRTRSQALSGLLG